MWSKVNYFLNKFPSEEWSGPAWYKPILKKDELYPVGFELIHFHPVDLGHGTATTIEAGDTAKILTKTWKNYPETEKAMMGIIHSHHKMGAFFSGTDKNCIEDNAPEQNFYCSTVVASAKERFAFAVGYKDQYGKIHIDEAEEGSTKMIAPPTEEDKKWEYIAKKIEKKKKETTVTGWYSAKGFNQGNLFKTSNTRAINGYGYPINYYDENPDEAKLEELRKKSEKDAKDDTEIDELYIALVMEAYEQRELLYETVMDELSEMDLDPNSFMASYYADKYGGNDVRALTETSEKQRPNTTAKA